MALKSPKSMSRKEPRKDSSLYEFIPGELSPKLGLSMVSRGGVGGGQFLSDAIPRKGELLRRGGSLK